MYGEMVSSKTCSVDGCERPYNAKGYCVAHYRIWRRGGDLTVPITRGRKPGTGRKPESEVVHGSASTYVNHKCRCDLCLDAWNEACRKRLAAKREQWSDAERKAHYSISYETTALSQKYKELRESRNLICDCCGKKARRLVTDHVHGTDIVRGFICDSCNTGIGKLGDDIDGILVALDYLMTDPISVTNM